MAPVFTSLLSGGLIAALLAGTAAPLAAQDLAHMPQQSVLDGPAPVRQTAPVPTVSRPVVQPVPAQSESGGAAAGGSQALNAALARLARDPRNVEALLDAGTAAMALGDMDAALGFLRRADEIAPGNGQVKAQMGKALVRAKDPLGAIRAFDEAQRGGANPADFAADRGLALDLVGDNFLAQQYYRQSLARSNDAEVTRRLALSLAISGNRNEAEKVLAPQLAGSDRAAWRVRTFILAISGNADQAVTVANASMPPQLAAGIAPYLRYLPRLTAAQQAAAANFGRFPRAADIGRDDPQIMAYALAHPRPPRIEQQAAPVALAAAGRKERGARDRLARAKAAEEQRLAMARTQVPTPPPAPVSQPALQQPVSPSVVPAQAAPASVPAPVPAPVSAAPTQIAAATVAPRGPTFVSQPVIQAIPAPVPASTMAPSPVAAPADAGANGGTAAEAEASPSPDGFAALFAGFSAPAEERERPVAAVDLAAVAAAHAKAAAEARKEAQAKKLADAKKAAAERKALAEKKAADAKKAEEARKAKEEARRLAANPARTWVQVLTGGDRAKMGKEWAGLQAKASELRGRKAYVTSWNRVYRLVTGPFPSNAAAQEFVAKLRHSNVSAFQFDSPAGQVMDGVSGK